MRSLLQTGATLLSTLALLEPGGTLQSAIAAGEAKGFHGYVCDDQGKPVPKAKVALNFRPVEVDAQGRFFLPHEKLKYDRTVLVTAEATFENPERNPPYRREVKYAGLFDYTTGEEGVTIHPP